VAAQSHIPESVRALTSRVDRAVLEYHMLEEKDRLLVAVSGGADSMTLLHLLSRRLPIYAPSARLYAVYVDMGFGGGEERGRIMRDYWQRLGVNGRILHTTIGPLAHSEENRENPCFLCSRIRRKQIFATAEFFGCNKIAFGHHKDDLVETLLLNMVFGREISTSPPNLVLHTGRYHLLRPLLYADEALVKTYAAENAIPVFHQACPSDGSTKRQWIKEWLAELEAAHPGSRENIFQSMKRVKNEYLLSPTAAPTRRP
jgi:tRNA 2-thiocytidine biosynthesis protein TtcA